MADDIARFVIDGREYEIPDLDTITMGEAIIIYDYSGLGLDELGGNIRHPGLIAAFMHIAYQRGNPGEPKVAVRELIDGTSLVAALEKIGGEDEGPPEQRKSEQTGSLPPSSSSSDESSGETSDNGSAALDAALRNIGVSR